jgi:hypothetical protein
VDYLWTISHVDGLNVLYGSWEPSQVKAMVESTYRLPSDRVVVDGLGNRPEWHSGGYGRELEFYPWDSSQSSYYVWKFAGVAEVGTDI